MSFTNADLAQKIANLIDYWSGFNKEYSDWQGGGVGGGPGNDGRYPLTDWYGNELLVKSPAQLEDDVENAVSGAQGYANAAAASAAAASSSETNAAASAAAALASESNASASESAAGVSESDAASSAVVATTQANLATDRAGYSQEWANLPYNTLVSSAAGGDQVDDYSARHWAEHAASLNPGASPQLYAQKALDEAITGQYTFSHASGILIGAASLTAAKIANWDTAYGWGNHASAGYASLAGNTFTGNHTFNDGFTIGDSAGRILVNDTGDGGTRSYFAGRNAGDTDWNWANEFGYDQANQYWYCDGHIRMQGGLYPVLYGYAPANTPDNYVYVNRNNVNPALYVMKDSVTGGPVAKFGSGTMNSTTFGGGAFEIQADGGFTADGAATFNGQVALTGSNGTTQNLRLEGTAPTIYLKDTDASSRDFWVHVNSNNFYVLRDNADDGAWDTPHPLQLEADTDICYIFGKRVTLHNEAHYVSGSTLGITAVSGQYGSVQTTGTTGGYGGYSIGGNFVFMGSGTAHCGIYDDINNEWFLLAYPNSYVRLYYNGASKLQTKTDGITVTGDIALNDANTELAEGSGNSVRVRTNSGYMDIGPQNTGYAHMQTDRGAFYMNKRLDTVGYNRYYQQGAYYANGSSSYVSGKVTFSTSAATGGSSGDIWYQYS